MECMLKALWEASGERLGCAAGQGFLEGLWEGSRDTLSNSFDGKRLKRASWFHAQLARFPESLRYLCGKRPPNVFPKSFCRRTSC
jgi:hypothetical protein